MKNEASDPLFVRNESWVPGRADVAAMVEYTEASRRIIENGISAFLVQHYRGRTLAVVSHLASGGKRLRGILTLLICEALGGYPEEALAAAVAVELAHAASLAHDDIIDGDLVRRGRPALHVEYDLATAILIPHLLVPQAVLSTERYGPEATRTILEGWARVVAGQVDDSLPWPPDDPDLHSVRKSDLDHNVEPSRGAEGEYWSIIQNKTGALFEAAAALGALAAHDGTHGRLARHYGGGLGRAFQIADDVTDLRRHLHRPWTTLLGNGEDHASRSLQALYRLVAGPRTKSITRHALATADGFVSTSIAAYSALAELFPTSPVRDLLKTFPGYAIAQLYREAEMESRYRDQVADDPGNGAR